MSWDIGPRQSFEAIPTGEYVATLKAWAEKIEEEDSKFSKKGDRKIEFTFAITVPDAEDAQRRVRARIPETANEKSLLMHVLGGLGLLDMQATAEKGLRLTPEILDRHVGRSCKVSVIKQLREGKSASDKDAWTDSIKAYMPYTAPTAVAPAAASPAGGPAVSAKLLERVKAMDALAGLTTPSDVLTAEQIIGHMRQLGAQVINKHAIQSLETAHEIYMTCGGWDPMLPASYDGMTFKDAMQLMDRIVKATDDAQ
jgi:hypothetical protein